jgi:hypothetical protein
MVGFGEMPTADAGAKRARRSSSTRRVEATKLIAKGTVYPAPLHTHSRVGGTRRSTLETCAVPGQGPRKSFTYLLP